MTASYTRYPRPNISFAMAKFFLLDGAMGINKYCVHVSIAVFDLMIFAQNANYASFQIQGSGKVGLNLSYNAAGFTENCLHTGKQQFVLSYPHCSEFLLLSAFCLIQVAL